jgi:hypothetical protein
MMIILLPSATKRKKPWNVGRNGNNIDKVIKDTWNDFIKKGEAYNQLTNEIGTDLECDCREPPFRPVNEVFVKDYRVFVFDLEKWKQGDECLNKEKDLLIEYARVLERDGDSILVLCVSNINESKITDLGIPKKFVYPTVVNDKNYSEIMHNYLCYVVKLYRACQDPKRKFVLMETSKRDKKTMPERPKNDIAYT